MADKYDNNEIYQMLVALTNKVDIGFKNADNNFKQTHKKQDITNGNVKTNTEFRISTIATVGTLKWVIGIFGFGTLVNLFLTIFNKTISL